MNFKKPGLTVALYTKSLRMPLRCNGGVHTKFHAFLTWTLDGPVSGQHHAPTALLLTKRFPCTYLLAGPQSLSGYFRE